MTATSEGWNQAAPRILRRNGSQLLRRRALPHRKRAAVRFKGVYERTEK